MKNFNGKAIYQPAGKAGEYAKWACNFYVGCSNGCEYCYLKSGRGAAILGGNKPTLKKCFLNSEEYALFCFESELNKNIDELQKHGLFFSFTTDPMLPETIKLTWQAMDICICNNIPVKILTKCADWVRNLIDFDNGRLIKDYSFKGKKYAAFGFTLTGHDELEKGASTNAERIKAMRKLHDAGFKTFASIEPIIDFNSSLKMIEQSKDYCNLYKIGLKAGDKYHIEEIRSFLDDVFELLPETPIYLKDSLLKQTGVERDSVDLPENCVGSDFNLFQ